MQDQDVPVKVVAEMVRVADLQILADGRTFQIVNERLCDTKLHIW
jgi:hypothetical protein